MKPWYVRHKCTANCKEIEKIEIEIIKIKLFFWLEQKITFSAMPHIQEASHSRSSLI